ncbi:MAG: protein jag [Clostridiales bacterium]|nr:protein jag [Clostridiales bacterium]
MEFTGKTVDETIKAGLSELGLTEEEAVIEVLETPTKGLFGMLKGKAVVKIERKPTGAVKAKEFVQKVLDMMDITAKAELSEDGENPTITLIAESSSSVIGYRGEVLDALQTLAGAIANIGKKEYNKVFVDCENYRTRREETLISLAHKLEEKATEMRRDVILEPMSPFERRIIHTALAESKTVSTKSDGKEPNRYVVIVPFDKDEFARPYNAGRNNNDRRSNRRDFKSDRKGRGGKGGFKGGKGKPSGGSDKRKSTITFGTYLGNSLKD